ncbi:MAG: 5-formyltetrahydrofolate cyclo-ligase [Bacillota bacterium]|nr:5-formyltetrahydrofolate cyclo-ligase [Negativicutes bacterium]
MKRELRAQLLQQRNALPAAVRRQAGESIQHTLLGLPVFQSAAVLMVYVGMESEICLDDLSRQLLRLEKRVLIPYLHAQPGKMDASEIFDWERELTQGKFNTRVQKPEFYRPCDPRDIEVIILPAVAFDKQGNRLGYGGGYYDRYLKRLSPKTVLIGVNYATQIVDKLPAYPHDMPVDLIVHEQGVIKTEKGKGRSW